MKKHEKAFLKYNKKVVHQEMSWLHAWSQVMEEIGAEYQVKTASVFADCGCGCRELCYAFTEKPVFVINFTVDGEKDSVVSDWTEYMLHWHHTE